MRYITVNNIIEIYKISNLIYLIFIIFLLYFFISILIIKISLIFRIKIKINFEKLSPFECGFNPIFFKRIPFSIRFFLITIIFLIFDVEIALILPIIIILKKSNLILWFFTRLMFNLILIIGLIHEWNNGALNWL